MKRDEIKLENGKYTFYIDDDHHFECDRYGKKWRSFPGDNAVMMLFYEALENKEKIGKIIKLINIHDSSDLDITYDPDNTMNDIRKIIEKKM